jgi:hypothetical protein
MSAHSSVPPRHDRMCVSRSSADPLRSFIWSSCCRRCCVRLARSVCHRLARRRRARYTSRSLKGGSNSRTGAAAARRSAVGSLIRCVVGRVVVHVAHRLSPLCDEFWGASRRARLLLEADWTRSSRSATAGLWRRQANRQLAASLPQALCEKSPGSKPAAPHDQIPRSTRPSAGPIRPASPSRNRAVYPFILS